MEAFLNYLPLIIAVIIALLVSLVVIINKPKKIKEWLIWACAEAEVALGSGTGKLKLRKVYDMFTNKYPFISAFISFEKFQEWTELALAELKQWISENKSLDNLLANSKEEKQIINE